MKPKKIYILGTSGSGKTYLAKKLSKKLNIPFYDSDDVRFIKKFSEARPISERKKLMDKIAKKEKWIIDARATSWSREPMKKADLIIWLKTSSMIRVWRIIKRYLKRRKDSGENLKSIWNLIKFSLSYKNNKKESGLKGTSKFMEDNKLKPLIIKNNKQKRRLLKKINLYF